MRKISVVVGGQFGSEGKGAVVGHLAHHTRSPKDLLVIRVGGPNAGHTAYDDEGNRYAFRQLPAAAATNRTATLAIAAGSEVDFAVLREEMAWMPDLKVVVDGQATVLTRRQQETEYNLGIQKRLGSTSKGIGAARSDRIWREAQIVRERAEQDGLPDGVQLGDVSRMAYEWPGDILIEGTQGYGLGLHAGYYPFCTSIDCRTIDMLSLAGVDPRWGMLETWVVFRTYPIRVAGNSGPLQGELTWDELSARTDGYIQPERTTVTQKVRRIGEWDARLARDALRENGGRFGAKVALTMLDYLFPSQAGVTQVEALDGEAVRFVRMLEQDLNVSIRLTGTGPSAIVDWRTEAWPRIKI